MQHSSDRSNSAGTQATSVVRARRPGRAIGAIAAAGALVFAGGQLTAAFGSGPAPEATSAAAAGQPSAFVPISSYRAYDSRIDPDESGKIFLQEQRFVDVAIDLDGVEQIPDEATAVSFNLTVTETESAGFVQISPPNTELGETSTVNWTAAGQTVANSGDALMYEGPTFDNNIVFHLDGAGGAGAHVIIDITGYYVPLPDNQPTT